MGWKLGILGGVILILASSYVYISSLKSSSMYATLDYPRLTVSNIDTKLIDPDEIRSLIDQSYFQAKEMDGFSSTSIVNNQPDIYYLNWTLDLMDLLGFEPKYYKEIKQTIYPKIKPSPNFSDLENIRMISNIDKHFGISNSSILSDLMKHYSPTEQLFYFEKPSESITDKIAATSIAVEALNNIGLRFAEPGLVSSLKDRMLRLYGQNKYFTQTNIDQNVLNNGGLIIQTLFNLGVTENDLSSNPVTVDRIKWFRYWNTHLFDTLGDDWYSVSVITSAIDISKFFTNDQVSIKDSYLKGLFAKNNTFAGSGYEGNVYTIQPLYVYDVVKICQYANLKYPYSEDLRAYIIDQIKTGFSKTKNPLMTPEDNYYGITLSDVFGYHYNKAKVSKLISSFYLHLVDEDSSISDSGKLTSIYYLILTYKEMNMPFGKQNEVAQSVVDYLDGLNYSDENRQTQNIQDLATGLETIQLLDRPVPAGLKNKIREFLKEIDVGNSGSVFKTVIATDVYQIIHYSGLERENPSLETKIKASISLLYNNGGYEYKNVPKAIPDCISTYKVLKVLREMSPAPKISESELKDFLYSFAEKTKLFRMDGPPYSKDLRMIYDGCFLSAEYKGHV